MLDNFNVSCGILSHISVTWGQTTENMLQLCNCWPHQIRLQNQGNGIMISQQANSNFKWKDFLQLRSHTLPTPEHVHQCLGYPCPRRAQKKTKLLK